jgi:glycosyltransferase involved in cell wall biosynthesis
VFYPKPIRVMHLITGLGVGGAETMLAKVLGASTKSRFASSVVSMIQPGPLAQTIRSSGVPVHSLGLKRGIPRPGALPALLKLIRDFRPDVLQAWMYHADILGVLAARAARVPALVWNIRCSNLDYRKAGLSLRSVFAAHGLLSRFTSATIVNSAAGMSFHQAHGHRPPRWEQIPNGFDLARFRADEGTRTRGRAELGLSADDIAIGMVARFEPVKDHATFLAAAKLISDRQPRAVFVLAGKGLTKDNGALMKQIQDAGLGLRVRLLGEYGDPSRLFPCFDIATLCSHTEGFPNAVGEAMSCELPCVATDVGDSALIIGDCGRLVPPRDPNAVAQTWMDLIALGEAGRRQLGAAARARIEERYSLPRIVAAYEALYTDLVVKAGRTPS